MIKFMKEELDVYFVCDEWYCWNAIQAAPLPTGWIDENKGGWEDPKSMNVRSRFVAKETKWRSTLGGQDPTFSSSQPLEGLKLMLSAFMTETQDDKYAGNSELDEMILLVLDVSRAHFHAPIMREVYIKLPREDPEWAPGKWGKLRKNIYGFKSAGNSFEHFQDTIIVDYGFTLGLDAYPMFSR